MKLLNTNRFVLKGQTRFIHLASIEHGAREFMCFADNQTSKIYIEEVTGGGGPFFVEDDSLAQELNDFLVFNRVLDMSKPLLPDEGWLRGKRQ
jgi:hypothetical protein